jgi:hypothetical protein
MSERQVVTFTYTHEEVFIVPKGIDLKSPNVKSWKVKYNQLYIYFVDDTCKIVDSEGWVDAFDFKYPDMNSTTIVKPEEVGIDIDEEEDEEEEYSNEKK